MGLDYAAIIAEIGAPSLARLVEVLQSDLPYAWLDQYIAAAQRPTNVMQFRHGSFEFVYDHYAALEATGEAQYDPTAESRLVAVCGVSAPRQAARDDYRLRGWVGPTGRSFGTGWDKGHFIAHSIGGVVDGVEANVFVQRRDLNRGWSAAGKRFRAMESYCVLNPGTFCFSRPLYADGTAKPSALEFGVLRGPEDFWVECFDNR